MNIELAEKVHAFLTAYPERHDQMNWASDEDAPFTECGTTGCIAGWRTVVLHTGADTLREAVHQLGHTVFNTDRAAYELLGISEDDAHEIFFASGNEVALNRLGALIEHEKSKA